MDALINAFTLGAIPTLKLGAPLRGFLATELDSVPMRISKKLGTGWLLNKPIERSLGRKTYRRDCSLPFEKEQQILLELNQLRLKFLVTRKSFCPPPKLYRGGNWHIHEQIYAFKLIEHFLKGLVDVPRGMTLRMFLSQELCCCPMRVSKKLGSRVLLGCSLPRNLGRTTFTKSTLPPNEAEKLSNEAKEELHHLRRLCFQDCC